MFVVSVPWIVPDAHPVLTICLVPIIVSAYVGGLGAGVVSTVVGVAGVGYLLSVAGRGAPRSAAEVEMPLASLGAVGFLISALSEALHRSRGRAEESRRLQAVTVASIGDGAIGTDAQGRVTFLDDEAARLSGSTNAGAQGS